MEKATKYIYETTVDKIIEEKVTEKRQENGVEIEVSIPKKTKKPVKLAILKPDRRKFKDADIFYAKRLSYYLKEGLLPYSLVSKRYANDGGPLSESEKRAIEVMREKYTSLQTEYFAMKSPISAEDNKRRGEILLEMSEVNTALSRIQDGYSEIFQNTAEAKSKNDTLEWWILNLGLINEGDGYKLFYGEGDFDAKMKKLEEYDLADDEFTKEVISKISYFVSFWYTTGNDIKDEDFKSAEEHYNTNISKYLADEVVAEKPLENKEV